MLVEQGACRFRWRYFLVGYPLEIELESDILAVPRMLHIIVQDELI